MFENIFIGRKDLAIQTRKHSILKLLIFFFDTFQNALRFLFFEHL